MGEVRAFVAALWRHWLAAMTGSVIAIVLLLMLPLVGVNLASTAYWFAVVWAVVIACFMAWRDEYRRAAAVVPRVRIDPLETGGEMSTSRQTANGVVTAYCVTARLTLSLVNTDEHRRVVERLRLAFVREGQVFACTPLDPRLDTMGAPDAAWDLADHSHARLPRTIEPRSKARYPTTLFVVVDGDDAAWLQGAALLRLTLEATNQQAVSIDFSAEWPPLEGLGSGARVLLRPITSLDAASH